MRYSTNPNLAVSPCHPGKHVNVETSRGKSLVVTVEHYRDDSIRYLGRYAGTEREKREPLRKKLYPARNVSAKMYA